MKRILNGVLLSAICGVLAVGSANAGVFRAVTKPVLHPKQTVHAKVSAAQVVHAVIVQPIVHVAHDVKAILY